jgi:hypothetical protein
MRKIFVSSLVLLALIAWTAPGFTAAETEPATETQADLAADEAPVDEPLVDEPLMTPAEEPEVADFLDLPQNDRERKIRECTPQEKTQHCGSVDCQCVYSAMTFYCFC